MGDDQQQIPETEQRGTLSRIFRVASIGIGLPLKVAGVFLWPPALRWQKPFSWQGAKKKAFRTLLGGVSLIGVYAVNDIAHTLTTPILFPTGQDYLKAQGVDPKIANELSDHAIRVRSRDFIGEFHAATQFPTFIGVIKSLMTLGSTGNAFAIPAHTSLGIKDDCTVMIPDPALKAADFVGAISGIPAKNFTHLHVTDREIWLALTFHEFAHCDTKNAAIPAKAESDADIRGILNTASRIFNNPEIGRTILYARALTPYFVTGMNNGISSSNFQIEDPHDAALDIDHAMNPKSPEPDAAASEELNALSFVDYRRMKDAEESAEPAADASGETGAIDALKKIADDAKKSIAEPVYLTKAAVYKDLLAHHRDLMSASAQRKAELYLEAIDYFGLNKTADNKKPAPGPAP